MAEFTFILCNPAVSENVGFSLRAMKTMGFSNMRIVKDKPLDEVKLRKTAYGSHDLLESVTYYSKLSDAVINMDIVIGTTAKKRTLRKDMILSTQLKSLIIAKEKTIRNVAIVFGSEENGLSKDELDLCDIVSIIPMDTTYPSLNLAQAVLLFAWELKSFSEISDTRELKAKSEYTALTEKMDELLEITDINKNKVLSRRIKDRVAMTNSADTRLLLSLINKILVKLSPAKE